MAQIVISPETLSRSTVLVTGEAALDGGNPTPISVAGKMRTVVAVLLSLKKATSPGVADTILTYDVPTTAPTTVNVYSWKPTSSGNPTLIAATGTPTFTYTIIGY